MFKRDITENLGNLLFSIFSIKWVYAGKFTDKLTLQSLFICKFTVEISLKIYIIYALLLLKLVNLWGDFTDKFAQVAF